MVRPERIYLRIACLPVCGGNDTKREGKFTADGTGRNWKQPNRFGQDLQEEDAGPKHRMSWIHNPYITIRPPAVAPLNHF